jgi:hypothetical protein
MSISSQADAPTSAAQVQRDDLDKLTIENERYMRARPDLNEAIDELVSSVQKRKPEDVQLFAVAFFAKPVAESPSAFWQRSL